MVSALFFIINILWEVMVSLGIFFYLENIFLGTESM